MARKYTNQLLEMVKEGFLDSNAVLLAALDWMSEDDVKEMMEKNEFIQAEEEDPLDDFNYVGSRHHY